MEIYATRWPVLLLLMPFLSGCGEGPSARAGGGEAEIAGQWSEAVGGLRGRLITSLDDTDRGSNFVSIYLELENVSDSAAPIELGVDREVRVELLGSDGQAIRPQGMVWSGPVPRIHPVALPPAARYRYRVSAGGCAGPGNEDVVICFRYAKWIIKEDDPEAYSVRGTMSVEREPGSRRRSPWWGLLDLPATIVQRTGHWGWQ